MNIYGKFFKSSHHSKWLVIVKYFMTPEDSRDTVYTEPLSEHPEFLSQRIKNIKLGFWILLALLFAYLVSTLQ
jgi:hypothetical protein